MLLFKSQNGAVTNRYTVDLVNKACVLMKESLMEKDSLSVEALAADLGISYSLFRKEFKRWCGISPGQYLQQLKLSKAKELLISTNSTLTDIAYALNFECIGQFSTFFKSKEGITPSEYRKMHTSDMGKQD